MTQGGSQTPGGKSVSRWNSSKHGLRSNAPVIPGLEATEDWEPHLEGILQSLQPQGHLERILAERVALQSWRLHRVIRYEREAVAVAQESVEEDFVEAERRRSIEETTTPYDLQVEAFNRDYVKSASKTRELLAQIMQRAEDEEIPSWRADEALWLVRLGAQSLAAEPVNLPGPSEAFQEVTRADQNTEEGWTVGLVKRVIGAYAERVGYSFEDLVGAAKEYAQGQERGAQDSSKRSGRSDVETELDRMRRERLIPDGKTLEKIARYEAHISRQMYQALHELEALQTRRGGGSAPLGRLDVQGPSET